MVTQAEQIDLREQVEELFNHSKGEQIRRIERELMELGFVQRGGDPAVIAMEHPDSGLVLEVGLDEDGTVHSYELLRQAQWAKKQEKFRW